MASTSPITPYAPSLSDEEIIASLRARVRSRMDGATATAMRASGIYYAYNFGLSIPQLRELASEIPVRLSLAEKLLSAKLREMRILGLMTYPPETLTKTQAILFTKSLETEELLSLYSYHLLAKIENIASWFPKEESLMVQRVWLNALSRRLLQQLPTPALGEVLQATLERLRLHPETLSSTEMNWLERLYQTDQWRESVSRALHIWEALPESTPLYSLAGYILSL